MNLTELSDAAFEALAHEVMAQRAQLRAQAKAIAQERDRRHALAKFAQMSPAEQAAIAQVLRPAGIPSEERVNGQSDGHHL